MTSGGQTDASDPFERIEQHVLLPYAGDLAAADGRAHERLASEVFEDILAAVPDLWLKAHYGDLAPSDVRRTYVDYLVVRLEGSESFAEEAARARAPLV